MQCQTGVRLDAFLAAMKPSISEVLLPWKRKLRADYIAACDCGNNLRNSDEKNISNIQLSKLRTTWEDCVADVPYYRDLVHAGKAPKTITTWEDFYGLPELNRRILQKHRDEFRRLSGPPDTTRTTGGSTGQPVKFGVWNSEDQILRVLKLALWARVGYTPDCRLFLIWGHAHLLGTGWQRFKNHLKRKAKDWLIGYKRADAYSLTPERCKEIAKQIVSYKPVGLIGYAAALDYFVRETEGFYPEFQRLGLKFVMPCAEPPPRPDTFALLREAFRAPIVQEFGGVDFGQVGMKIDDQPFHVFSDHNILEVVPQPGEPNDRGAALVTTLYRRYLPLIRYRQGDVLGGVKRLPHGHVYAFDRLIGRENDMVKLPGGAAVHSVAFLHCVHQEPAITNAQLVLANDGVSLRVICKEPLSSECEARIRHRLGQLSPELKTIDVERVADLQTSIAGKRRWFVDNRD